MNPDSADPDSAVVNRAVEAAISSAYRNDWTSIFASTLRATRGFELAEDCVQDAFVRAAQRWPGEGIPKNPAAWLTTTARNRAFDLLRRSAVAQRTMPLLIVEHEGEHEHEFATVQRNEAEEKTYLGDDRLRLILTCCHPALSNEARIALTLRMVCGMTTGEVARSFLVSESTMAARITRAKKKIAQARIPYRIPEIDDIPERIDAVLEVVHLLFTAGYSSQGSDGLVQDALLDRAMELAHLVRRLMPGNAEAAGLLALLTLTDARRGERMDAAGRLKLLADQDRSRWDRGLITAGTLLAVEAMRVQRPGKFALMASIAALHDEAPSWEATNWPQIVVFYEQLIRVWPAPVAALNRAVAIRFAEGASAGLAALDHLEKESQLTQYHYFAVARGDCLRELGRLAEARAAYTEALSQTTNNIERAFLEEQLQQI